MKNVRKIIEIDDDLCTGCGECVPDCAEGSLRIINGKARLVADKLCDGLGACLGSCPTGALRIIEREADKFDEKAVEDFLAQQKQIKTQPPAKGGCPSANFQLHSVVSPCQAANRPGTQSGSALAHWPIQIRLIQPSAPFLENCDLLIAADCTAVAHADFQRDFLQGRIVMLGCPKFDDAQLYVDRFTEIFKTRTLRSITVLIMEVPCCASMLGIIKKARDQAGSTFPVRQVVVSTQGKILHDQPW